MVTRFDRGSGRRGDEVYESLATALGQAEQRVRGLGAELDRLRHEAGHARHQEVERTARLSRARLVALHAEEVAKRQSEVIAALGWEGPVFAISALSGEGTAALTSAIMTSVTARAEAERQAQRDAGAGPEQDATDPEIEPPWHPLD